MNSPTGPLDGTVLELTSGALNQASSAYYAMPVDITAFNTVFDFIVNQSGTSPVGDGLTLVIQNAGPTALGSNGAGLGYATIPNSVAIKFDDYNNAGEGTASTGLYINGATPTVPSTDLHSIGGPPIYGGGVVHVQVTYDGTTLTWQLVDPTALWPGTATQSVAVNIPQTVGSNIAYIGFTGSSGGTETEVTEILDWTFSNP